jgi:multidrug resistance efflux pump
LDGKTQASHGRQALITSIVLHPIIAVFVAPGDRVKAGQKLIEMDRDEPEAEVRSRKADVVELESSLARIKAMPRTEERAKAKAELEAARATAKGAIEQLARLTPLLNSGSLSPGQQLNARTAAEHAEASERAAAAHLDYLLKLPIPQEIAEMEARLATAKADLEVSEGELLHYTLVAPIDGVISWLDAPLGRANRPGTVVWGEIIDLREIDVRCAVTPEQADGITTQAAAELVWPAENGHHWTGRVVFVGPAADAQTGLVPVVARFDNAKERLRANIRVKVRLSLQSSIAPLGAPSQTENRIPGG